MRAMTVLLLLASCAHAGKACLTVPPPELHPTWLGSDPRCPQAFEQCMTKEQLRDLVEQLAKTEAWIADAWKKCGSGEELGPVKLAESRGVEPPGLAP